MYNRDYMLRMIEMLGEFVATILNLVRRGDFDAASRLMERVFQEMLRRDAAFFNSVSKESLTTFMLQEHNFTDGHLAILSELFYAQGELSEARGESEQAFQFYEKALVLLEFVIENSNSFSLDQDKKRELLQAKIQLPSS